MEVVLQSTNALDICFAKTLLSDVGVQYFVLDEHISAIEGCIGIFPVRVMVCNKDTDLAKKVLAENNLLGEML